MSALDHLKDNFKQVAIEVRESVTDDIRYAREKYIRFKAKLDSLKRSTDVLLLDPELPEDRKEYWVNNLKEIQTEFSKLIIRQQLLLEGSHRLVTDVNDVMDKYFTTEELCVYKIDFDQLVKDVTSKVDAEFNFQESV